MANEKGSKTASERLFEAYLNDRGVSYRCEAEAQGVRPDFWVDAPGGLVVCEVTSPRMPKNAPRVGAPDPYESVCKALEARTTASGAS